MSYRLVLASTSPFRRQILEKLGLIFETASPDIDESRFDNEPPEKLVERLALQKAQAVAEEYSDALIIGSDQVACLNEQILGKPGDYNNAVKQLQESSGNTVIFLTGLCLLNTSTGKHQLIHDPFKVHFKQLESSEIDGYLQKEKPYNCAGSFKSEALGIALFEKLEGDDPNSLMGLPLIRLIAMLNREGLRVI